METIASIKLTQDKNLADSKIKPITEISEILGDNPKKLCDIDKAKEIARVLSVVKIPENIYIVDDTDSNIIKNLCDILKNPSQFKEIQDNAEIGRALFLAFCKEAQALYPDRAINVYESLMYTYLIALLRNFFQPSLPNKRNKKITGKDLANLYNCSEDTIESIINSYKHRYDLYRKGDENEDGENTLTKYSYTEEQYKIYRSTQNTDYILKIYPDAEPSTNTDQRFGADGAFIDITAAIASDLLESEIAKKIFAKSMLKYLGGRMHEHSKNGAKKLLFKESDVSTRIKNYIISKTGDNNIKTSLANLNELEFKMLKKMKNNDQLRVSTLNNFMHMFDENNTFLVDFIRKYYSGGNSKYFDVIDFSKELSKDDIDKLEINNYDDYDNIYNFNNIYMHGLTNDGEKKFAEFLQKESDCCEVFWQRFVLNIFMENYITKNNKIN